MRDKFLKRHLGFSLTEVVVAVTIIGIMAAAITLSSNVGKTTAKAEAKEIAARILRVTKIAGRIRNNFHLIIYDKNHIYCRWEESDESYSTATKDWTPIASSDKFTYDWNVKGTNLDFSLDTNGFNQDCNITVTNNEDTNNKHYIYFYQEGGRIRTTDTED